MQLLTFLSAFCTVALTSAQQYEGDVISGYLPTIPRAEVAYFKIPAPTSSEVNTLITYNSLDSNGNRPNAANIERAVITIHGLLRDPWDYMNDTLNALELVTDENINQDSVAVLTPYFTNGDDKGYAYPWNDSAPAGYGSTTNALVWKSSEWSAGADNQYPHDSRHTSSYYVMDTLIQYFDNKATFPNLKQIVLVGHSLGGQMLQRYAAVGNQLNTSVPVVYWIGNPDSFAWLSEDRPLSTVGCPTYDVYRDGYTNYTEYPMTYGTEIVAQGRDALLANYQSRQIAYGRALYDHGNEASTCGASTTGQDRNERFFFFIKSFPPSCSDPAGTDCDTVDLVAASHDNGQMFQSDAGLARLFTDNFYGDGSRAYDFGYPRNQTGDDPYPNPALVSTPGPTNFNVYTSENLTYQGCWTNQYPQTAAALPVYLFNNASNTETFCAEACVDAGYTIAGMQGGSSCFCGNALDSQSAVLTVDTQCNTTCPAYALDICGGSARMSIFSNGYPIFS